MDFLEKLGELLRSGMFEWFETLVLGVLLLVFLMAPALENKTAKWRDGTTEMESTGLVIRAISGVLIITVLLVWLIWG